MDVLAFCSIIEDSYHFQAYNTVCCNQVSSDFLNMMHAEFADFNCYTDNGHTPSQQNVLDKLNMATKLS